MPFETGLLGCMEDKSSCLDSICCWPCQIGRQCAAVNGQVNQMSCLHCLGALFVSPLCCAIVLRCKVSDRYSLGESCIFSACIGYFCTYCSLCQTHRQLTLRGDFPGGFCVSQPYTQRMT